MTGVGMRVGILGGTFNPVHNGHLAMAEGALAKVPLDKVLWIPALVPPHKNLEAVVSPEERCRMVELAIVGRPEFELSRIELDRPSPSYMVDTVRQLQADPRCQGAVWFLLVGADLVGELSSWRSSADLIRQIQFLAVPRSGHPLPALPTGVKELPLATPDVSSSEIRKRIQQGLSVEGMVPPAVLAYIRKRRLYS